MKNYLLKIFLPLLFLVPILGFAQGNLKVDANHRLYYEKVFDAPGLTAAQIQPQIISKMSAPGIKNVVAADKIIVAEYANYNLVTFYKKGKLIDREDGYPHFFGKIKIDIKDNKYRVTVTNMQSFMSGQMFDLEEIFSSPAKFSEKHVKVYTPIDTYFTNYFSLRSGDDW